MFAKYLRQEFKRNFLTRLAGLVAIPVIKALKARVDHRRYNGASLLGLYGIVVKSHGSADRYAFGFAIKRAVEEVHGGIQHQISERMQESPHHSTSGPDSQPSSKEDIA